MLEVSTNLLWVGNAFDIRQPRAIFDLEINTIVDLAYEEPVSNIPRQFTYCRFPLNDGGGNELLLLTQTIRIVAHFLQSGTRTLVACSMGMSRSPAIASFALAYCYQKEPKQILDGIARRKALQLHPKLWLDLETAYQTMTQSNPHKLDHDS